ncbi:MAG: DUF1801 domain-containing protein [Taibaiella sp.]|nr:DUF1801 domain-containing protein [Taibaiella sp.]
MPKLNQEQLLEIFDALKKEMKPYEKENVVAKMDIQGKYDLWAVGKVEAYGRQYPELGFCTIIVQSSYVGFYYMPIYGNESVREKLDPEFLKLLKGKACFHIKHVDKDVIKQVRDAMKIGYEAYKKMGWIKKPLGAK